jgi:hypothetical protein
MTKSAVEEKITMQGRVDEGIMSLVVLSGGNSRDHGFHDDWPEKPGQFPSAREVEQRKQELRRAIAEKLALVHEEISEALGEIRSGRDPLEVYFVQKGTGLEYEEQQYDVHGVPQCKPEGFLVELADAVIRIGDLAYLVGDVDGAHLAQAERIKAEYNETRPYKHGRKF